jgi:hypothetical protein
MESIRFRCSDCRQTLKVSAEKTGRKVRCNRCEKVLVVPAQNAEEVESDPVTDEKPAPQPTTRTLTPKQSRSEPQESVEDNDPPEEDEIEDSVEAPAKNRRPKRKNRGKLWQLPRLGVLVLLIGTALAVLNLLFSQVLSNVLMRRAIVRLSDLRSTTSLLEDVRTVIWFSIGISLVFALIKLAGFSLCLFAPSDSGSRPFAVLALIATVLTTSMSAYTLWIPFSSLPTMEVPDETKLRDRKELDRFMRDMAGRVEQMQKDLRSMRARMAILGIIESVLSGMYLICVPLLLRTFCRALKLVELESNCEVLLKIGAAILALGIATRLLGMLLAQLGILGWVSALMSLGWEGFLLFLLIQLWRAMPAPTR